jgi:hypothetical protein
VLHLCERQLAILDIEQVTCMSTNLMFSKQEKTHFEGGKSSGHAPTVAPTGESGCDGHVSRQRVIDIPLDPCMRLHRSTRSLPGDKELDKVSSQSRSSPVTRRSLAP